jgi:hypothetical protein
MVLLLAVCCVVIKTGGCIGKGAQFVDTHYLLVDYDIGLCV